MIKEIASHIANWYCKKGMLASGYSLEVYRYGFELLVSTLVNVCVLITIGIVTNSGLQAVMYCIGFVVLRMFAGGYHATTHLRCILIFNSSFGSLSVMSNSDISTGRNNSADATGLGYEVKSTPGYNKTTTFFYPGDCNINRNGQPGIAAYMFYTLGGGGGAQDLGIGYFNGYWQPIVSGIWTGWATGSTRLAVGDKLYFKIWIDGNNNINFQGIDGDNFNNILFQGNYTTWGQLPASGSGVTMNRQITYAANKDYQKPHTGYYLNNARFDQAYLYNNSGYAPFNASNTTSTRRGKFGTTWAPVSLVTIHSNTHWDSEKVSINMR